MVPKGSRALVTAPQTPSDGTPTSWVARRWGWILTDPSPAQPPAGGGRVGRSHGHTALLEPSQMPKVGSLLAGVCDGPTAGLTEQLSGGK